MSGELSSTCSVCGQANNATSRYCSCCGARLDISQQKQDWNKAEILQNYSSSGVPFSGEIFPLPRLTHHPAWGAIPALGSWQPVFIRENN